MTARAALLIAAALVVAACGGDDDRLTSADTVDPSDWDAVLEAADGTTVRWYLWGGSEAINSFVDDTYGTRLAELGITLERVPVADTADAVAQVIAEEEAGVEAGSIDLIWINGTNFGTLADQGLLLDGWARSLPNAALVDVADPRIGVDFGRPIDDVESPWSSAQLQLLHDSARLDESELPRSYAELAAFACDHPGRVTYVAPSSAAFQGTRFLTGSLYELAGGPEAFAEWNDATWERWGPELWAFWGEVAPCLWRAGETYPESEGELNRLLANGEVDFGLTLATAGAGPLIDEGAVPASTRAFVFDANMIGDANYVAIPRAAPNPVGAWVVADLLLEPELQAFQSTPESGFGLGLVIDPARLDDPDDLAALDDAAAALGPAAVPPAELAASAAGDPAAEYQARIEAEWRSAVLER